jgi:hypothetical protein
MQQRPEAALLARSAMWMRAQHTRSPAAAIIVRWAEAQQHDEAAEPRRSWARCSARCHCCCRRDQEGTCSAAMLAQHWRAQNFAEIPRRRSI